MPIKIGSTSIGALKIGSANISNAYVGSQQVFSSGGARYLTSTDFPNTTTLYGWRAGSSAVFDVVYGGVSLSQQGSGYESDTDHIGNSTNCKSTGSFNYNDTTNSNVLIDGDESFSFFCWFKVSDWESDEEPVFGYDNGDILYLFYRFESALFSYVYPSTFDLTPNHGLTGSAWHSLAITRDVSAPETIIYVDGSSVGDVAAASDYGSPSILFLFGLAYGTDFWLHKNTIWTPVEVAALHAIGVGS